MNIIPILQKRDPRPRLRDLIDLVELLLGTESLVGSPSTQLVGCHFWLWPAALPALRAPAFPCRLAQAAPLQRGSPLPPRSEGSLGSHQCPDHPGLGSMTPSLVFPAPFPALKSLSRLLLSKCAHALCMQIYSVYYVLIASLALLERKLCDATLVEA